MPTDQRITELVDQLVDEMVGLRRDLHAHPELGFEEHRTSGLIQRRLDALGIDHRHGIAGGTGLVAHFPGAAEHAVALRADLDALPLTEAAPGRPHASQHPGKMHACGHDGHTAVLAGTAAVLARLAAEGPLPLPVTLLFQPAEEGGGGARRMIADGCLDGSLLGPPVTRIYALHGWPEQPVGTVATRSGPFFAASDTFRLTVRGRGAHAGWPHVARDPVVASAALVTALQTVTSRNTDPVESLVLTVTQIHGGSASNVIPDQVELRGTIRSFSPSVRELAHRRLNEVATGIARAHGCAATVDLHPGYPATHNDHGATQRAVALARQTLGEQRVLEERPVMGAEDFAYYAAKVPSCFLLLGLQPEGGEHPSLHQADFDFNDDALSVGMRLMTRLALEG